MKKEGKITISIAGINILLVFCLLISIATATIQISNYPNPFSPKINNNTTIAFYVFDEAKVTAIIYDLLGKEVKNLSDDFYDSGEHKIKWDGKNDEGENVAKGGYLLKLTIRYQNGKTESAIRKIGVL